MKPFNFLLQFTSGQRKGIVASFLLIIVFQAIYFIVASVDFSGEKTQSAAEKEWLALQPQIDALKLKKAAGSKDSIYPFNPNFISDYKGYTLGMKVAEIDRLHAFRKTGKFINSPGDFQKVTKVSDSLLAKMAPYFKFPDWVDKKQNTHVYENYTSKEKEAKPAYAKEEKKIIQLDINTALEEDLVKVYGIGPSFAKQLLRRRADLGAFASIGQMDDFTDFSPEAIAGLKKSFKVAGTPEVNKINVNTASLQQLSRFPYFNKNIAKSILTRRSMNGKINNIEELSKINDFPVDKIKIITLYLEF